MKSSIFYTFWISATVFLSNSELFARPLDSIGTKVRNGKVYIIHEVDKGTGLYTVAKRYGITIEEVTKENPGSDKGLIVGQLLYIPTGNQAPFEEPVVKEYFKNENKKEGIKTTETPVEEKSTFATYHIVQPGETLFGIAKKYGTSVAVIKDLNSLPGEELSPGLKLVVPANGAVSAENNDLPKEQVVPPTNENPVIEEKPKEKRNKEKKQEKSEEVVKEIPEIKPDMPVAIPSEVSKSTYSKKVENLPEFDVEKVTEIGIVGVMMASNQSSRNVCLHHEASENTIIMVTNPMNKKAVFVKVTGKYDFKTSGEQVIQLSKNALDQIGLAPGASVEISYAR